MTKTDPLSQLPADLQKLEAELDPEMQFRPLLPRAAWLVAALLLALSCFHYYTAGFGLLPETTHRSASLRSGWREYQVVAQNDAPSSPRLYPPQHRVSGE